MSTEKYYSPTYDETKFHCIHCGIFAAQSWHKFYYHDGGGYKRATSLNFCVCAHCGKWSYWFEGRMIVPAEAPVPTAHVDMPNECLTEYDEARSIVAASPRASAALLRLAVQKLMVVLGEKGNNINEDIGVLVSKGLPIQVQQALGLTSAV